MDVLVTDTMALEREENYEGKGGIFSFATEMSVAQSGKVQQNLENMFPGLEKGRIPDKHPSFITIDPICLGRKDRKDLSMERTGAEGSKLFCTMVNFGSFSEG